MRIPSLPPNHSFTLAETMIAVAVASTILGATLTASIGLQKSFNSVNNYFGAHMQQIRIIDYLTRDAKRALSVTSSIDHQTVTIMLPRYLIQAGDSDANGSNIGTPRAPTYSKTTGLVSYGPSPTSTISTIEYRISGFSIVRVEDGVVTTIASSTNSLIPDTIDTELANTEYTTTAVKFQPISGADRNGTVVYSTSYLRNRRRTL